MLNNSSRELPLAGAEPTAVAWPAGDRDLLARVRTLVRADQSDVALGLVARGGSPWVQNARAVCLLRLDRPAEAVAALRPLVFDGTGLAVRADAAPVFQANYATALLLDGNADGFYSILAGIRDRSEPAVARLDDALRRWRAGMNVWQRARSFFGLGGPAFRVDFPPGDL